MEETGQKNNTRGVRRSIKKTTNIGRNHPLRFFFRPGFRGIAYFVWLWYTFVRRYTYGLWATTCGYYFSTCKCIFFHFSNIVDETAQAAGYNTSKLYHITKSQQFIRWFGDWQNKPDIMLQQNLKTDFWRRTESLLLGEGGAPPKMKSKKKCLSVRA